MRVKTYDLLRDQIEAGIHGGLAKAQKREYLTLPKGVLADNAAEEISCYVMNALSEYFDWQDEDV